MSFRLSSSTYFHYTLHSSFHEKIKALIIYLSKTGTDGPPSVPEIHTVNRKEGGERNVGEEQKENKLAFYIGRYSAGPLK